MVDPPQDNEPKPDPPAFAAKAGDLDALSTALSEAASVSGGLWLSYLFVLFYLLVAVAGVTHKDLLFEAPVKLPFLNVDLPLTGFFWLGPVLFLIVHAYVLLHFVMFAGKVAAFDAALRAQIPDLTVRTQLRRQLPSNIFIQFLAGPRDIRDGLTGLLLWLIALISLVIGPVALLLYFQLQFLPYHSEAITWLQRIVVVIELALVWRYWPAIGLRDGIGPDHAPSQRRVLVDRIQRGGTLTAMVAVSGGSVLLIFGIATFPGETLEQALRQAGHIPLRDSLVAGVVDPVERRPTSYWSNRLVLPSLDVTDSLKLNTEEKIAAVAETISLRGRHLEGAVLIGANLRKADLTATHLQGAWLDGADLRGARLGCATSISQEAARDRTPDVERCTRLEGASLKNMDLKGQSFAQLYLDGASFDQSDLRGASLDAAHLARASFWGANLDKATLRGARMTEVTLTGATLRGAIMTDAILEGATLDRADLTAASLGAARLDGASAEDANLTGAQLQGARLAGAVLRNAVFESAHMPHALLAGAILTRAHMNGARLEYARLNGAIMEATELQGAILSGTDLNGAWLARTMTWRTDPKSAKPGSARVESVSTAPQKPCPMGGAERHAGKQICPWGKPDLEALKVRLTEAEPLRADGSSPGADPALLDPDAHRTDDSAIAAAWAALASAATPDPDAALAGEWRRAACEPGSSPFALRRMVRTIADKDTPPMLSDTQRKALATALLAQGCTAALTAPERAGLIEAAK